jgi:hypothetical protein
MNDSIIGGSTTIGDTATLSGILIDRLPTLLTSEHGIWCPQGLHRGRLSTGCMLKGTKKEIATLAISCRLYAIFTAEVRGMAS